MLLSTYILALKKYFSCMYDIYLSISTKIRKPGHDILCTVVLHPVCLAQKSSLSKGYIVCTLLHMVSDNHTPIVRCCAADAMNRMALMSWLILS